MNAGLALALTAALAGGPLQEKGRSDASALPRKGDAVAVKGCLRGGALEFADIQQAEGEGVLASGLTFRLTGGKAVLKELKGRHDGRVVQVRGVLKSDLQPHGGLGATVGRMRITIGAPSPGAGGPEDEARRSLPVVQVTGYEGSETTCGR